jgi:hypothetical protein
MFSHHIYRAAEQVLQVLFQFNDKEQFGRHVYAHIHVASVVLLIAKSGQMIFPSIFIEIMYLHSKVRKR